MTRDRARGGFTFVELLVVMIILGMLVYIAYPKYHDLKRQGVAGKAAGDYHAIKLASYAYHTQYQTWPAEVPALTIPPELVDDLPEGYSFNRTEYTLDFQNWMLPNGLPQNPGQTMLLALTITASDSLLAATIRDKLGRRTVHFSNGNTTTFAILEE